MVFIIRCGVWGLFFLKNILPRYLKILLISNFPCSGGTAGSCPWTDPGSRKISELLLVCDVFLKIKAVSPNVSMSLLFQFQIFFKHMKVLQWLAP